MNTDTPRTDQNTYPASTLAACNNEHIPVVHRNLARQLERELAELKAKYRMHHEEAERITSETCRVSSVCRELKQQRDMLAEALREMWPFIEEDDYPNCNTRGFSAAIQKYKQALAAVEGGSHE